MTPSVIAASIDVDRIRAALLELGDIADIPDDHEFTMTAGELRGWAQMLAVLALLADSIQKESDDGA